MDQSKFHNAAVAAQEKETGGWILEHHLFTEWRNGTKLFLVIYGTGMIYNRFEESSFTNIICQAGCGKTVLWYGM